MDVSSLIAVVGFALVTSITPGPNNMMLLASGVNHGFRASLPHVAGISSGLMLLFLASGMGVGAVLAQWPQLYQALKWVGVAYLVWLAWQLWRAAAPSAGSGGEAATPGTRPLGFWPAAAFQWVNPKAWLIAVGAVTGFLRPASDVWDLLLLALVCGLVNAPCVGLWAWAGARLSAALAQPKRLRLFNAAMALTLLASAWPMLNF